jgi:hypothetical protein
VLASKTLAALAIVVTGIVAAFAVYTFGWREDRASPKVIPATAAEDTGSFSTETSSGRLFVLRDGDRIRDPRTGTICQATGQAGVPSLVCVDDTKERTPWQAVVWADRAELYDITRTDDPLVPTFVVPVRPQAPKG